MNNTTNNKKDNTKKTKRRAYESLLLLLLTISLFITATFAWFTDSAFSKGNKVFAGNLYIDILADASELETKYEGAVDTWNTNNPGNQVEDVQEYIEEVLGCEPYSRTYPDSETGDPVIERYYITTGTEAGGINLYNMEPGQVRKLDVKYVNTGDLAFKAGGALKFDYDTDGNPISYTGLETLKQQKGKQAEIYRNNYAVGNGASDAPTTKDVFLTSEVTYEENPNKLKIQLCFENQNGDNSISIKEIENLPIYDINITEKSGIFDDSSVINEFKKQYVGLNYNNLPIVVNPGGEPTQEEYQNYFFSLIVKEVYEVIAIEKTHGSDDPANVNKGTISIPGTPVPNTIDPKLIAEGKDTSGNDYSYYSAPMNGFDDDKEYEYRFKKLVNLQAEKDAYGNPKKYTELVNTDGYVTLDNTTYYKDEGGHLEEVLEVYVIPSANKTNSKAHVDKAEEGSKQPQVLHEIIDEKDIKKDDSLTIDHDIFTNKDNPLHDEYYFGNLEQFTFLMDNGAIADKDYDYKVYAFDDTENEDLITLEDISNKPEANRTIEEQYMLKHNSIEANLYEDYQRYLGNVGGYCLPKDAVTKDGTVTLPYKDGVDVLVYDEEGNSEHYRYSEMGECEIYLYMPTTADSRYQNASISLSIGATATQVEYEMDDTGYMLYDKFEYKNKDKPKEDEILLGDVVSIDLTDNTKAYFRVMKIDNDNYTLLKLGPNYSHGSSMYKSTDSKADFTPCDDGSETLRTSIFHYNYSGSTLQKTIQGDFENLLKVVPSNFEASIVSENVTQYGFEKLVGFLDRLNISENQSNEINLVKSYTFKSSGRAGMGTQNIEYLRNYYNSIGNLSVRSLSMSDIFDFFTDFGVEANSSNLLKILANHNAQASSNQIGYTLMDVDSSSIIDGLNFFAIAPAGNFSPINDAIPELSDSNLTYCPVFTVDTNKFNDFDVVEHYGAGNSEDVISVGVSLYKEYQNERPLQSAIEYVFGDSSTFDLDIQYAYIEPNQQGHSQASANPIMTQKMQIESMINSGIQHIIVEPVSMDVISYFVSSNADIYYVGNLICNMDAKPGNNSLIGLATQNDYKHIIEDIINEYFSEPTDIKLISSGCSGVTDDFLFNNVSNAVYSAMDVQNLDGEKIKSFGKMCLSTSPFDCDQMFDIPVPYNPNVVIAEYFSELSKVKNCANFKDASSALYINYFGNQPTDSSSISLVQTFPHYEISNNYYEVLDYICDCIKGETSDALTPARLTYEIKGRNQPSPDDEK